ncbi:hypothetical protein ACFL5K_02515 [Gemmatimonadota bacterium]
MGPCCIAFILPRRPQAFQAIRFDRNPYRWTITTSRSTYQVILAEDKNLTPGFFGSLSVSAFSMIPSTEIPKRSARSGGKYLTEAVSWK